MDTYHYSKHARLHENIAYELLQIASCERTLARLGAHPSTRVQSWRANTVRWLETMRYNLDCNRAVLAYLTENNFDIVKRTAEIDYEIVALNPDEPILIEAVEIEQSFKIQIAAYHNYKPFHSAAENQTRVIEVKRAEVM
jgi:hypothetical protein